MLKKEEQYLIDNFNVSRETLKKIDEFIELVVEVNAKMNLISKNSVKDIFNRHIVDSIQLKNHIVSRETILDFGSGAGFPGIILSILGYKVTLVESITKKCRFLEMVKEKLGLDCQIINQRVEDLDVKNIDVITARAVASLNKLLLLIDKNLGDKARAVFLKGASYKDEIMEAEKDWQFKYNVYKNEINKEGVILEIKELKWK
jgi:16S rRNA (guanine527-N7)-methyltransferase